MSLLEAYGEVMISRLGGGAGSSLVGPAGRRLSGSAGARSSSSASSDRSSDRTKSRVATSPTAIRSEATSRARYSMSAWARTLASRSCSATTRSRASCRFWASRISGAAYDAWAENQVQQDERVGIPLEPPDATTLIVIHKMTNTVM